MSIRGNPMLVFNQCKYKFSRIKADGTVSWRCFVDGCKAILETDANRTRILDEKNIHVHEPTNNNDVEKIKVSNLFPLFGVLNAQKTFISSLCFR